MLARTSHGSGSELLDWCGVRLPDGTVKTASVHALDAFPGQGSDAAELAKHLPEVIAGLEFVHTVRRAEQLQLCVPERTPEELEERVHSLSPRVRVRRVGSGRPQVQVELSTHQARSLGAALRGRETTDRFVSVVGSVGCPKTLRVPLGTTVAKLLSMAQGTSSLVRLFFVQGFTFEPAALSRGLTPDDDLLVALEIDHPVAKSESWTMDQAVRRVHAACSRCGACRDICPANPSTDALALMDALRWPGSGRLDLEGASSCVGCRLCETVCPAQLPVGRLAHATARRLSVSNGRSSVETNLVQDVVGRRFGLSRESLPVEDRRAEVRRVRFQSEGDEPLELFCGSGDQVWKGETIARDPATGRRIVAPFSGRVVRTDSSLTVARSDR